MRARDELRQQVAEAADRLDLPISLHQAYDLADYLTTQRALTHAPSIEPGPAARGLITRQQYEALAAMASGETCREVGERLGRAEATVRNRRRLLYRRLGARSGPHAVAIAIRLGILTAADGCRMTALQSEVAVPRPVPAQQDRRAS